MSVALIKAVKVAQDNVSFYREPLRPCDEATPQPPTPTDVQRKRSHNGEIGNLEVESKIEEDSDAIGNQKSQLPYIFSRPEGAAKTNITTIYELES